MEFFIAQDGEKRGPITLYRIRDLLESGEITGDTLGWMRGEEAWVPIREIEPILAQIQAIERRKLDEEMAESQAPKPTPEPVIAYNQLHKHAMARFGARWLDFGLFHLLLLALMGPRIPAPQTPEELASIKEIAQVFLDYMKSEEYLEYAAASVRLAVYAAVGWHLIESILLATIGTTPGKLLLNLRVVGPGEEKLGFGRALGRSVIVLLLGMGLGYKIFPWVGNVLSYVRLRANGTTHWDHATQTQVRQGPITKGRILFVLLLFLSIFFLQGQIVQTG